MNAKHALIIEDEAALRLIYKEVLQMKGWLVSEAANGQQALTLLSAPTTPALVFLDLHLPTGSGLDVLRVIRAEEKLREIYVVVISADPYRLQEAAALANATLLKPTNLQDLLEIVP